MALSVQGQSRQKPQVASFSSLEAGALESPIHYTGTVETDFPDFQRRVLTHDPETYKDLYLGKVAIIRQAYPKAQMLELRRRLHAFGQETPESFHKIAGRCPNFHTINNEVGAYKVMMRAHAYHFFSWNREPVDMFAIFKDALTVFETLGEQDPEQIVKNTTDDDLVVRLQAHHYPPGGGLTQMHRDPTVFVKVAMVVLLSKLGKDFTSGGLYLLDLFGNKYYPERELGIGDMVVFYPQLAHGVDAVDPDKTVDWTSDRGRWTVLFNNRPPA